MDIGFALNWENLYLINVAPDAEVPVWARLGQGISSVETDDSDETSEDYYYDGEGSPETDVTGTSFAYEFEGHRYHGNHAQDWIASLRMLKGAQRRTKFKHVFPDGATLVSDCTVLDIESTGGDANEKETFACKIALNGTPVFTEPTGNNMPESITASDIAANVDEPVAVNAQVMPATASQALVYGSSDPDTVTVDDDGMLFPKKTGTCEISLRSVVKPTVATTIKVTVGANKLTAAKSSK